MIFAREPIAGQVKSRLAQEIGSGAALMVYRRLLSRTLALARRYRARRGVAVIVASADGREDDELARRARASGFAWQAQRGADLGSRMCEAFERAFASGFTRVILIGCDCPVLRGSDLDEAFAALEQADAAFSPTDDGGYALIALRATQPLLFSGIAWGSDEVLGQTSRAAQAAGVRMHTLRQLWDVDRPADLRRWQASRR